MLNYLIVLVEIKFTVAPSILRPGTSLAGPSQLASLRGWSLKRITVCSDGSSIMLFVGLDPAS